MFANFRRSGRSYTRLTSVGLGYLIILVLVLLAAWNTGTNLLYIIVGGLASFVVVSAMLSRFLLRGVTLHRSAPRAVYRGQPFQVHVRVENHRRWLPAVSLQLVRDSTPKRADGYVFYLPRGQAARLSLEECFHERGDHPLDGYRIVCGFPFGLLERCCEFSDATRVLVYPRVHGVRSNALQRIPGSAQLSTRATADGDEYYGLREYIPGDDIRRIVWRTSARLGKWIVRELGQYQSKLVILALDTAYDPSVEDFKERFEDAVDLTASIAIMLLRRRNEVSIINPGGFLEGGDGKGHERRVLEMLARVTITEPSSDLALHIDSVDTATAAVLLISPNPDKWGETTENGRVLDPRELVHG